MKVKGQGQSVSVKILTLLSAGLCTARGRAGLVNKRYFMAPSTH